MLFILLKPQPIYNLHNTYMLKDRRQFEDVFIQQDLMIEMRQVQKKVDFLIESHQHLIQLIKKSLPLLQVQPSTVRKQQIISPFIEQYSQVSGLLINSYEDTTQRISFYDDYRPYNQIHGRLSVLNHQNQEEENQEKFRQMIEQEDFQQSNIQVPQAATAEVYPKEQDLFGVVEYKDSKIKLAHPQKILESLRSQFRSMNLNFNNCQCLYAYPQMSNQSFFQKITDNQNVIFLAQLQNQEVIGAFSQIGFSSKTNLIPKDNPKCCLFNLTRNHFLYAQRTNKTHSCDKNYILFGNWQYKIKMGENIMNSDLGKRGDCFKKQKYGVNQKEVANTRQWIFGQLRFNESCRLMKYMICALK